MSAPQEGDKTMKATYIYNKELGALKCTSAAGTWGNMRDTDDITLALCTDAVERVSKQRLANSEERMRIFLACKAAAKELFANPGTAYTITF